MSSPKHTNNRSQQDKQPPTEAERERLRDIIIVIVTYPLTPTKQTEKLAASKPWLEVVSLFLKLALAAYALYEGINGPNG